MYCELSNFGTECNTKESNVVLEMNPTAVFGWSVRPLIFKGPSGPIPMTEKYFKKKQVV